MAVFGDEKVVARIAGGLSQDALEARIEKFLETLNYREREVIRLRYGLDYGRMSTLEETGRVFKVTRERVRQIEAKAIRKLQDPARTRELEGSPETK